MRWEGGQESSNIEDRRGFGPGLTLGGGGILLVLLVSFLTGTNPLTLLNLIETTQEVAAPPAVEQHQGPPADRLGEFAAVVLKDTETTWHTVLPKLGRSYREPRLVLFTGSVRSGCGLGSA